MIFLVAAARACFPFCACTASSPETDKSNDTAVHGINSQVELKM